jgi:hypothetical protein
MNKKAQMLAMMGLGLAMLDPEEQRRLMDFEEKPRLRLPIQEKPPTGTKEYFFNSIGEFSTKSMLKTECIFKCYAINDKNAKRKFAKWQKTNCT